VSDVGGECVVSGCCLTTQVVGRESLTCVGVCQRVRDTSNSGQEGITRQERKESHEITVTTSRVACDGSSLAKLLVGEKRVCAACTARTH
jgi:hypothetical protein